MEAAEDRDDEGAAEELCPMDPKLAKGRGAAS